MQSAIIEIEGNYTNKIYIEQIGDLDKLMEFLYGFNAAWIKGLEKENAGNQFFTKFRSDSKKLMGLIRSGVFWEYALHQKNPIHVLDGLPLETNEYGWDIVEMDYLDPFALYITVHLNGMIWLARPKGVEF